MVYLVGHAHITGESRVWLPLGGGTWSRLLQHLIDLLERETLALWNHEVGEEKGSAAKSSPHEEDLGSKIGLSLLGSDQVWGDNGNDAVPHPVGGGGESDTTGADWQVEDLTDDDPCGWSPSGGEEEDVDANESNHGGDGGGVVVSWLASGDTEDTDDELGDDHSGGTEDENEAATEALNGPEGDWGGEDVDEGGDEGDQEWVVDRAEGLEEDGTEVEDEVHTSQLLEHLESDTEDGAANVGGTVADVTLEAVGPSSNVVGLWDNLHLVLVVGNDLSELILDVVGVLLLAADGGESLSGLLELSLLDEETWRLWKEEETDGENDSPKELDADWDSVRSSIVAVLGGVDDAVGEQDTDGNAELVTSDEGTANLPWCNLGHVKNDDGRDESNSETGNDTTNGHENDSSGSGLKNGTNGEDSASHNDSWATTDNIGDVTSSDGTEEGTGGENRGHKGLVVGGDLEVELVGLVGIGVDIRVNVEWVVLAGDHANEVWHSQNTSHPSSIVSEEDTSKCGESTHEVGLHGDRSLNAIGVIGASDDASDFVSRHCVGGVVC